MPETFWNQVPDTTNQRLAIAILSDIDNIRAATNKIGAIRQMATLPEKDFSVIYPFLLAHKNEVTPTLCEQYLSGLNLRTIELFTHFLSVLKEQGIFVPPLINTLKLVHSWNNQWKFVQSVIEDGRLITKYVDAEESRKLMIDKILSGVVEKIFRGDFAWIKLSFGKVVKKINSQTD